MKKPKNWALKPGWVLISTLGGCGGGQGRQDTAGAKAQTASKPSSEMSEGGSLATAKTIVASDNAS